MSVAATDRTGDRATGEKLVLCGFVGMLFLLSRRWRERRAHFGLALLSGVTSMEQRETAASGGGWRGPGSFCRGAEIVRSLREARIRRGRYAVDGEAAGAKVIQK